LAVGVVAKVGDDRITTLDLQLQLQQMARSNAIPPELVWLYARQVLDQMVMDKVTAQEAERLGLGVSESELRSSLRQISDLFPGGKFVGQQQYETMVLNRFGTTVEQFEERFRGSVLQQKLRYVVTDGIGVSDAEIREAFLRNNEKLVLQYVFLDPKTFEKEIIPTDAALEEYFKKNQGRYALPEKRTVQLLVLDNEAVRQSVSISDADRNRYYQDHLDDYRLPERVSVQHILLKAAEPAQLEEARKKAEDLLKQLRAGADFAELAKKNSEDTANAAKGGDLGWILRGQTVPEFEKVAFTLAPGTVSDPVQTEYGIHLIKVAAHEQARLRPLEEVRSEVDNLLRDQRVQTLMENSAEQAAAEWRRAPEGLDSVANKYHGRTLKPPALAREDPIPELEGSPAVIEDVFLLEEGQIGRPVPVPTGYVIPMLLAIVPARPAELAEVNEQVRTGYISEQAIERAQTKALELAQTVEKQEKRDLSLAARNLGLKATTSEPLLRSGAIPSVGNVSGLGATLETLQPGQTAGPVPIGGGQLVYQLVSRELPKEEDLAIQREIIRQQLLGEKHGMAFALYQQDLKNRLTNAGELQVYEDVLARLSSGMPQ
jgi:peptidyl-prolyl cis-trans isomerase D